MCLGGEAKFLEDEAIDTQTIEGLWVGCMESNLI